MVYICDFDCKLIDSFLHLICYVVDGLVQYVRDKMPLISKELMSVDDVEAFLDRYQYSVIGWFLFFLA